MSWHLRYKRCLACGQRFTTEFAPQAFCSRPCYDRWLADRAELRAKWQQRWAEEWAE